MEKGHYIYFIQAGDQGPIKIGVAASPRKRLIDLQVANPVRLHIRHQIFVGRPGAAFRLERRLHAKMKKYRTVGEWFTIGWYLPTILKANAFNFEEIFQLRRGKRQWV